MTVTITRLSDDATTTPLKVLLPIDVVDESRNVETDLLSGDMAITLIPPRPGTGELVLLYADEAAGRAGRALHRVASAFSLADTVNADRNITYVLAPGGQRLALDPETRRRWLLTVSYREVEL